MLKKDPRSRVNRVKPAALGELARLIQTERYWRTKLKEPMPGEKPAVGALREWWASVANILRAMGKPNAARIDLASELFLILGDMAQYLAKGQIPELISDVRSRGRTAPGPREERHIRVAVTYRRAVEQGLICDRQPVQTIMKRYGLRDRRAVQQWCSKYSSLDLAPFVNRPDLLTSR
jgi:hypothetical protein